MVNTMTEIQLRPYDSSTARDREALWDLKVAFETELGGTTEDERKAKRYDGKLTEEYKRRWLSWVDRCVEDDERCLTLAADDGGVGGYIFVLPERLGFIWDAAVVNELYVDTRWRGEGVADALLDAAIDLATEQTLPLDRLLLDVSPENGRAYRFYERYGFEPWGEIVALEL